MKKNLKKNISMIKVTGLLGNKSGELTKKYNLSFLVTY